MSKLSKVDESPEFIRALALRVLLPDNARIGLMGGVTSYSVYLPMVCTSHYSDTRQIS